jgi:integrase
MGIAVVSDLAGKSAWVLRRILIFFTCDLQTRINLEKSELASHTTAKAARELAQDKLAEVWKGKNPQAEKREKKAKAQAQITLRTAIDNFLTYQESKLRPFSLYETRRYLLKIWKPLHGWPIDEIRRQHVADILDKVEKAGPVAAARARSTLSTLFRWAMGRGYVDHNPVIGTLNPDSRVARERVLTDDELRAIWHGCCDNDFGAIVKLLILTGARRSEVGAMAWQELNIDDRTWTIPAIRTKNANVHKLPLPHACWAILEQIERRAGIDHLFGRGSERGFQSWGGPKKALDERCEVKEWTLHDLRRTAATRMADLGIQPHVIEALLNHVSGHKAGVAGIYNRSSYEREVRNALAAWADHVHAITTGTERRIVPIREISA